MSNAKLIIVTGLSGAGMSSTLKALEDNGYEVIDNFPLSLVDPLMEKQEHDNAPLAVGIDCRTRGFSPDLVIKTANRFSAEILFLTADDSVLQNRFNETRRRHPLASDRPVSAGIEKEKLILANLKDHANRVLDTSDLSIHDLRRLIKGYYGLTEKDLTVTFMSFGYKNGIPKEADIVMDVRFLKNPNWVPSLKPLTGNDEAVGDYIKTDKAYDNFRHHFTELLQTLLPHYREEGKSYLTIAIGCTGGRHRSVFIAGYLKEYFEEVTDYAYQIINRDL